MIEKVKQMRIMTLAAGCVVIVLSAFLCGCEFKKRDDAGGKRDDTGGKRDDAGARLSAYEKALGLLKEGKQDVAEETLSRAVQGDQKNQRLVFFMGVCARSRWMKRDALPIFDYVVKLNPETPEAKCSALMLAIDTQKKYEDSFAALEKLHQSHPEDPLILWMTAVACRELGRRDAPKVYSEKGAQYYAKLLETLNPGPVLLHQTCANILSEELGRHEEALKHREIALRLEPASWSHQGMANTLSNLGRYTEADAHYQKCIELDPDSPSYLASWAWSMGRRNEHEKALELYKKAADIAPDSPESWSDLARCAAKLNRMDDAARYNAKAEALEKTQK